MLEDLKPKRNKSKCNVKETGDTLNSKDAQIFWDAISDPDTWSAHGLHRSLKERGLSLTDKAIKKHRQGTCGCSVA